MNVTNFFSDNNLLVLPTRSNPRVFLAIDSPKSAKIAFNLYNPFSIKARLLKNSLRFLCVHWNKLAQKILPTLMGEKSNFISYLEEELNTRLICSVYIATEKDKFVVQLQDEKGVAGYLKFPITKIGKKRLLNEQKAVILLAERKIVPEILLKRNYNGIPFIVLQSLNGSIEAILKRDYKEVLDAFKSKKKYVLRDHPRILQIREKLEKYNQQQLIIFLKEIIANSKNEYLEVYEHGDFAPWNLIQTLDGLIPFDFEYFKEHGLEYLDEIKFHFQVENLLNSKSGMPLVRAIFQKTSIEEFTVVFRIFLLKEIVTKLEAQKSYDFELSLLELVDFEKA